jgi:hypothetical protein
MGRPLYLHYSIADESFFDPETGALRSAFALVRNDAYTLRCQAVLNRGATISLATYQASTRAFDLSSYSGTPAFGLKTASNFAADGDYTQVWSGFATDASWHSLSNGRLSMEVAPTVTPATYYAELQLQTSGGSALSFHGTGTAEGLTRCVLARDVVVGSEATAPSGVSGNSGTATITAPADCVDVTYTGMTASGVVIVSLLNTTNLTTLSVTPGTGTFRIAAGAAPSTTWTVAYLVASL